MLEAVELPVDLLALAVGVAALLDLDVDLFTEDGNGAWRVDTNPHFFAHDRQHRDLDVVADHDRLIALPR